MPLSAGTRLGPYEILAPIGAGGIGEVYRAVNLSHRGRNFHQPVGGIVDERSAILPLLFLRALDDAPNLEFSNTRGKGAP